jgi:16S rRNA (adenine1518-N6/adenine1519-N6)-dimethyltransferase
VTAGDGLPPLREVLSTYGISPRRSLGQNFIFDLNLTRRIAREANIAGGTVYEVGPGPGGLTRALLELGAARVIVAERDHRAIPALQQIAAAWPAQLDIIEADAIELREADTLAGLRAELPVSVVSNLPFNAGTALFVKWLSEDWPPWWSNLTLMFQKEVAERVCARPGDDAYGRLAVLTQWRSTARILFNVSRHAFIPPPKVTAAVLRVERLAEPKYPAELRDLERVTAAAFGQRRKMLRSSLKTLVPQADRLLEMSGVAATARAEELTVEQFCTLARSYRNLPAQRPV